MSSVNLQIVIGRVGNMKEIRWTAGADPKPVCEVSIATDHTSRGQDATTWHRCVFWGNYAESVTKHAKVGTHIYIQGRTEDQEHGGRYYRKVHVEKFRILADGVWDTIDDVKPSHRPQDMPGPSTDPKPNPMEARGQAAGTGPHHDTGPPGAEFEDDIPF